MGKKDLSEQVNVSPEKEVEEPQAKAPDAPKASAWSYKVIFGILLLLGLVGGVWYLNFFSYRSGSDFFNEMKDKVESVKSHQSPDTLDERSGGVSPQETLMKASPPIRQEMSIPEQIKLLIQAQTKLQNELESLKAQDKTSMGVPSSQEERLKDLMNDYELLTIKVSKLERAMKEQALKLEEFMNYFVALSHLKTALLSGSPFASELLLVNENIGEDNTAESYLESLSEYAETGISTLYSLREEFPSLARRVLRAQDEEENRSFLSRAKAFLKNSIVVRRIDPPQDNSIDSLLAQAEKHLNLGNVKGAMQLLNKLPAAQLKVAQSWLAKAQEYVTAVDLLAHLESSHIITLTPVEGETA